MILLDLNRKAVCRILHFLVHLENLVIISCFRTFLIFVNPTSPIFAFILNAFFFTCICRTDRAAKSPDFSGRLPLSSLPLYTKNLPLFLSSLIIVILYQMAVVKTYSYILATGPQNKQQLCTTCRTATSLEV